MRARAIVFLGCIVVWGSAAYAQAVPPRFEVGGSGGVLAGGGSGELFMIFTAGPRLTFNVTPRDGLEIVAEIVGPVEGSGLYGLYVLQVQAHPDRPHGESKFRLHDGRSGRHLRVRAYQGISRRTSRRIGVRPATTHARIARWANVRRGGRGLRARARALCCHPRRAAAGRIPIWQCRGERYLWRLGSDRRLS